MRELDIPNYLTSMKTRGYSIIGIEQSNNSVCLSTFEYPKKSVLLLGKEREGIPAELMHLLDHVIEIPQMGIIRYDLLLLVLIY